MSLMKGQKEAGSRFKQALSHLKNSGKIRAYSDILAETDYTSTTISEINSGRQWPNVVLLEILRAKFRINTDWILMGEGEMMLPATTPNLPSEWIDVTDRLPPSITRSQTEGDRIRSAKAFGGKEKQGIIYVPIPAQAGYTKNLLDPVYMNELGRWKIDGLPYEGERFRVFQVKGSSMEYIDPVTGKPDGLFEGMDIVAEAVETSDWKLGQIPPYHVYVVVTEDAIMIKRLLIKDGDSYVMHSDNPNEKPRQKLLLKSDIRELWYVKRKLDWGFAPPEKIEIEI